MCAPIWEFTIKASVARQTVQDCIAVATSMGKLRQWQELRQQQWMGDAKGSERWQKKETKILKASWLTSNSLSLWLRRRQYFTLSPGGLREHSRLEKKKKLYKGEKEAILPLSLSWHSSSYLSHSLSRSPSLRFDSRMINYQSWVYSRLMIEDVESLYAAAAAVGFTKWDLMCGKGPKRAMVNIDVLLTGRLRRHVCPFCA